MTVLIFNAQTKSILAFDKRIVCNEFGSSVVRTVHLTASIKVSKQKTTWFKKNVGLFFIWEVIYERETSENIQKLLQWVGFAMIRDASIEDKYFYYSQTYFILYQLPWVSISERNTWESYDIFSVHSCRTVETLG